MYELFHDPYLEPLWKAALNHTQLSGTSATVSYAIKIKKQDPTLPDKGVEETEQENDVK